jgi:vacuolar-type H+-ATPase subunit H
VTPEVDDTLKRLLAAENAASDLVKEAQAESERVVQTALQEAHKQEPRFLGRVPELQASFLDKSNQRAQQAVAEMERRFEERLAHLRAAADANEESALDAAFNRLLGNDDTGTA